MAIPLLSITIKAPVSDQLEGYSLKGYNTDKNTNLKNLLGAPLVDTFPDPDKNFIDRGTKLSTDRKSLEFRCAKSINHTRDEKPPRLNLLSNVSSTKGSCDASTKERNIPKKRVMCIDSYETKLRDDAIECYLEDIKVNDIDVKTCVLKVHIVNIVSVTNPSSDVYRWYLRHCSSHYPLNGGKFIRNLIDKSEKEIISFNMLNSVPSLTITTRFNVVTSKGECVEIGEELTQYRRFYEDAVVATDFIPLQSDVLKSLLSDHCALEAAIRKAGEQGNIPLETHKDTPFSVHVDAARNLELLMKVVASVKKSEIQPASKEAVVSASREMPEFYRYLAPEFFTSVRVEASTRNEKTSYDWEKIGSVHSEVLSTRGSQKKHGLAECLDILNFYSHCACQLIIEKGASECMLHKVTFPLSDNEKIFKMSAALEAIFLKSGSDLWSQPDESKLTSPEHLIIRELEIQFYSKLFFSESSMCFRKLSPLVCFVRMTGEMVAAFDKNCIKISFTHPCRDFINLYHQRLLQYCCGVSGDVDCSQWPEKLSDSLLAKVSNRYAIIDLSERTATASIVECVLHSVGKDKVLLVPAYYINESGKQVVIHCFGSGRVFDLSTCREGRICDADLTVPKVLPGAPCTVALSSSGKKLIATLYSHPFRACEPTGEEAVDNNKYDFTIPIEERNTKERNEELFR